MRRVILQFIALSLALTFSVCATCAQDTIKIGLIEVLSGPFGAVGQWSVRHFQIAIDDVNQRGGVLGGRKLELVQIDSKGSPQEAVLSLRQAIDDGLRYIAQGNGSSVALALSDAIGKHNERNPTRPILFLTYMAGDPALTNERCNYWHFRFEAHLEMKMVPFIQHLADQPEVKSVYLFNQDYSWGHGVSRLARQMLLARRPDIRIVGDDLIPIGKVKDFAPYVAKIRASGADVVLTGNWGNDLNLLLKAGNASQLPVKYYAFFAHELGSPTVIGEAGAERMIQVTPWHANIGTPLTEQRVRAYWQRFKAAYNDDLYYASIRIATEMLAKAIDGAHSDDPRAVAKVLRGMRYRDDQEEVWMRPEDHQLIQPLYISTFTRANGEDVKFDLEGTGLGFKTERRFDAREVMTPTTCRMRMPGDS